MGRFALIIFVIAGLAAPTAGAQEWQRLDTAGIGAALEGQTYLYSNATQRFYRSGRTLYDASRESWGKWRVTGDQYCSQWPPNDLWSCYDVEARDDEIRFIGREGDISTARRNLN